MSISRINIQTATFNLRAVNIRGPQLNRILDQIRQAGGAALGATAGGSAATGPGAMQSPAERFPQVAAQNANPESQTNNLTQGFAPGGSNSLSSLDPGGMMNLVMQLLQRLLEALFSMLNGSQANAGQGGSAPAGGSGGGGCGAGTPAQSTGNPAGDPSTPPATTPPSSPPPGTPATTPPRNPLPPPTTNNLAGSGCASPAGLSTAPGAQRPSSSATSSNPSTNGTGASHARARPRHRRSLAKRILAGIGKGSAMVAGTAALPGAPVLAGTAVSSASRIASAQGLNVGQSLEDRIFQYMSSKLRESESELQNAMEQSDSSGASGGDSRSAAAQKVQQLIQKRSEMVELLSNSMKTMHDSSMAVNRNIRS